MGLTPTFKIETDTKDITQVIADRLLSLTVDDASGIESDTAQIILDDSNCDLILPPIGSHLHICLGYRETALENMGVYTVDELALSSPPQQLTIRAKAVDMSATLKAPKTQTWQQVSLKTIVDTLAYEHGLKAIIADALAGIHYTYVHQTQESSLNLLTRLTQPLGATAKIAGQHILIFPQSLAQTPSGIALPHIQITPNQTTGWRIDFTRRDHYPSVQAHYWDSESAQEKTVCAGVGKPLFTLRKSFSNATEALHAAHAQLNAFSRSQKTCQVDIAGDARISTSTPLMLSGFKAEVDGCWITERICHTLTQQGYLSSISAIRKSEN